MGTTENKSKFFSFYTAVITITGFAVCFYLFLICFTGTFRLISDIGSVRVLFLNPIILLLLAVSWVLAAGIYILRSQRLMGIISGFDDEQKFKRTMSVLKAAVFFECLFIAIMCFGMRQRVDQYSIQYSAYGLSWNVTEVLTPPRHLGVYPNNAGIVLALYLLSFLAGHYNNAVIMLLFSVMVPFIYSDLAEIGGKFGLSRKSQIMVMFCGLFFLPLQMKVTFIYGDIPGLFFGVKALKLASDIALKKSTLKNVAALTVCMAAAYVFKNNFIIFAIAIVLFLIAVFIKQRRYKELYIPLVVIAAPLLMNYAVKLILGAILGGTVSSGASKYSWIAMGMQEDAGTFNGYNDATYYETGFDVNAQTELAKGEIAARLNDFLSNPNQAIGFYIRKVLVQWSDPTYNAFEFSSRNVYLYNSASPLLFLLSDPRFVRIVSSFLKVFQIFMFLGSGVFAVSTMREKNRTPALLLITAFIGGYFFHLLWEAGPSYAVPFAVLLLPTGVAGMNVLVKKLSSLKIKELTKARIQISASGFTFFVVGTAVVLLAAAGIGTIRQILAEGSVEYKTYFDETLQRSRYSVPAGRYYLKPVDSSFEGDGLEIELVRYAGKYRIKFISEDVDEMYLTDDKGSVIIDWCSYDATQVFVIVQNYDGTYSICRGQSEALTIDPENGLKMDEFVDYTYIFDDSEYRDFISEHPDMTWRLVPV